MARRDAPVGTSYDKSSHLAPLVVAVWLAVLQPLGEIGITLEHRRAAAAASLGSYGTAGYIAAIVVQMLVFAFVLWSAITMHRKSRLFPTLFRVEMVLLLLVPLAVALIVTWESEHGHTSPMTSAVYWVRVAIFAPAAGAGYVYSLRSVRFRNTFVR